MMKIQSLTALTVTLAIVSCTRQDAEKGREHSLATILATAESHSTTRLKLAETSEEGVYDVNWESGAVISVLGISQGASCSSDFTLSSGSGTSVGTFSGDISKAGDGPYYAVFPSGRDASLEEGTLSFDIPQKVSAQNGNVAKNTIPCVARLNSDYTAPLRNVFGLLKVTLKSTKSVTIKKIVLHDLGGNMLWGRVTVPIVDGVPRCEEAVLTGGDNTVYMLWNGSTTLSSDAAKTLFFAVPAGALDRGFSMAIYEKDDSASDGVGRMYSIIQKVSSPVAAERSVIIDMDEVTITEKSEPLQEKARGYYKTLFVDAGMGLSRKYTTSQLPWINGLGLASDYEYFASDTLDSNRIYYQSGIFAGSPVSTGITWSDANGVLLYPDGEPRFRTIYVNGGTSRTHGRFLESKGRSRVHDFFANGGSYVGTCAGSFLASTYVDGLSDEKYNVYSNVTESRNYSFGIWPGTLYHTGIPISNSTYGSCYTSMSVLKSISSGGHSIAAGDTLEQVRQHGGSYLPDRTMNNRITHEEWMTYQYTEKSSTDPLAYNAYNLQNEAALKGKDSRVGEVSTFSYDGTLASGRAVLTGSHPESISSGKQYEWMMTMVSYSLEGNGEVSTKGELTLGQSRTMDKATDDDEPGYTKIGDRQYHHFTFTSSSDIEEFELSLDSDYDSDSGIDLYLTLRKGDYAWLSDADYVIATKGGQKSLSVKNLPAGEWYVGVYCATTVTATATSVGSKVLKYFKYTGHTEVLDGVAYTITASVGTKSQVSCSETTGNLIFNE